MMMQLVLLVVVLTAVQLMVFAFLVGAGRGKYNVPAPAMSGHPTWERLNRVHQNSLEQAVTFIPLLLVFSITFGQREAVGLGVLYLLARSLYAVGYVRDPKQRGTGAMLTFLVQTLLALGSIGAVLWKLPQF
jgi:glutathione S-transferase